MDPRRRRDDLLSVIDNQLANIAERVQTSSIDASGPAHGFIMLDLLDASGIRLGAESLHEAGLDVEAVEALERFRGLQDACLERGWTVRALLHWGEDVGVLRIVVDVDA